MTQRGKHGDGSEECSTRQEREAHVFFQRVFDALPGICLITGADLRILAANDAYLKATGLAREKILGRSVSEAFPNLSRASEERWSDAIKASLSVVKRDKVTHATAPQPLKIRSNGPKGDVFVDCRWVGLTSPVLGEDGSIAYFVHSVTDVTEPARSNNGLDELIFMVVHDLREPLRAALYFIKELERSSKGQLSSEGNEFLGLALGGAKRLKTLVDSLLEYARIGGELPVNRAYSADANAAVEIATSNLKIMLEEAQVRVSHDTLPTVNIEMAPLVQVLQNLIENGAKYRRGTPSHVHISAHEEGGEWIFSVEDDGIGIPKDSLESIFLPLRRLHSPNEYSGVGMGLALCKRIVERYGGRIWAASNPGEGSTFYFSLRAP